LSEIANAAPVPEWILLLGKFLGLSLILVVWMALLAIAGVLVQARMNYHDFEIGLYLKVLFGLQLPEYLLFACLAFALHVLVNQKHLGHLASLVAYGFIAFASMLGIEHHLLVYSSLRTGLTRICAASVRRSDRGCGSSSIGQLGRCYLR
jgi:ABC-type transport system involved in multi-copper enzyme maturation permease subunit